MGNADLSQDFVNFFIFLLIRKLLAALADLREATQLCPSNPEIKRLLARVEEECKQFQRTQQQKHPSPQLLQQINTSDNEEEGTTRGVDDNFNLHEREDELPHPDEPVSSPQRLQPSSAAASYSRVLQEGVQQKARSVSPQSRTGSKYLREPGLVLQPTKQAQIVKTNQHLSSIQPASKTGSGRRQTKTPSPFQHLPQSPLPVRHSKIQHLDGTSTASPGSVPTGPSSELYHEKFMSSQCSHPQQAENVSSHSLASKAKATDRLTAPAQLGDPRQQSPAAASTVSAGSPASSTILATSACSLSPASGFSDSTKGLGPDVRLKESNVTQVQGPIAEHRPRTTPFMGITDKTARFQQQTSQASRTWHPQAADGLSANVASGGIQASSFEQFSAKHYQTKLSSTGAAPGESNQNGVQAKEREELKCQIPAHCQDNRAPLQAAPSYPDAVPQQPAHVGKEGHLSHVASAKPKRSFIESNV